jgi:PAS domain S-box-containing protein
MERNVTDSDETGTNESNRYAQLIEHIQDAVVEFELVEEQSVIRDVNDAFVDVFGYEFDAVRGESLNEWIVPEWRLDEARALDERTAAGDINYRRVKRETSSGLRTFLYRGIPVSGASSQTDGFAVYTDLTELRRVERRQRVLNRVMRHNLRNVTTVITGNTTRLLDDLPDEGNEMAEVAAVLERAAAELEKLTREAGEIETILSDSAPENVCVDCVSLVRSVVEDYRDDAPAARIETDLPDSLDVATDENITFAIDSLIENAIEHNPTASPTVRVRATADEADGWAAIRVADDGPLIHESERDVVTGEAEITQTRHGSGLGLWLVKWTTEVFGGELSFGTSDLGGNVVCLRLPRATDRSQQ